MRVRALLGSGLLLLVSCGFSWLLLNAVLYYQDHRDERGILDVLAEEWRAGRPAIPALCPRDIAQGILHPSFASILLPEIRVLLGTAPKVRNVYCNEDDGWYLFESDRFGFNNPDYTWDKPAQLLI